MSSDPSEVPGYIVNTRWIIEGIILMVVGVFGIIGKNHFLIIIIISPPIAQVGGMTHTETIHELSFKRRTVTQIHQKSGQNPNFLYL